MYVPGRQIAADFKKFAFRGNLIELAVGFTVGAAFTTIASSLVNDVVMPPVGLIIGSMDFSDFYLVLKEPAAAAVPDGATLAEARELGAVTLNYGAFISTIITFFIVAVAMFAVIRIVNKAEDQLDRDAGQDPAAAAPSVKKCPFCLSSVPFAATRCAFCTSELPAPEKAGADA